MQVTPYLSFNGDCEAAFTFYERCFGATIGAMFRYGGSPMANQAPAGSPDKIMHGSVTIGDLVLNGADAPMDSYEEPRGFSLSIQVKRVDEADRIFRDLADGGRVVVPLEQTFWAARFGMVIDRFGIPWMINCEGAGEAA
jgi:PhnB protein